MPSARATKSGTLLAESDKTIIVEGNHYFPPQSIVSSHFKASSSNTHTHCPWKGDASYYDISLPGAETLKDAAWFYPQAFEEAKNIEGYVAFYKSKVQVEDV